MSITRNMINFFFFSLLVFAIPIAVYADAIGWHWYNEIQPLKKKEKLNQKKHETAVEEMAKFRAEVEEAKAQAILYPSEENVSTYIALQKIVTERAANFTRMWQKVLLDYPSLNYAISNPTENNAQHVVYAEHSKREKEAIAFFREKYGLFFFYRGNDPLDQELSPTIANFGKENGIAVQAVSMDGKILPIFANTSIDTGQAKKLSIQYFPALILVDPKNHKVKPLNYGFIAGDELRRRFLQVATDFQEGT